MNFRAVRQVRLSRKLLFDYLFCLTRQVCGLLSFPKGIFPDMEHVVGIGIGKIMEVCLFDGLRWIGRLKHGKGPAKRNVFGQALFP